MSGSEPRGVHPPRWARWLLARVAPSTERQALLDDLDEELQTLARRDGDQRARSWYRRQALTSVAPLLRRRLGRGAGKGTGERSKLAGLTASLGQDLRYGARALIHDRGYTIIAAVVLACGIGANTMIFSLVAPYLLRPLPYADADRLVHVFETNPRIGGLGWDMVRQSVPTVRAWRQGSQSLEDIGHYYYHSAILDWGDGDPERQLLGRVSPNLFSLLGVAPSLGRQFDRSEAQPGAAAVILVADSLWRSRFAADPSVLGRSVRVDGVDHVLVGVMPPGFNFPFGDVRIWAPTVDEEPQTDFADRLALTIGRLAPGATAAMAAAELGAVTETLAVDHPDAFDGFGVRVVPLKHALIFFYEQLRVLLVLLLLGVGFVLLIVSANVANLSLVRAARRQREIAVRAALGAGRGRITTQLLVESVLLAAVAGSVGIGLGAIGIRAVSGIVPAQIWRVGEVSIDGAALAYSAGVTLLTAVAFGLAPALRSGRLELTPALKEAGRLSGRSGGRLSRLLVAAQITTATVLCGSALTMIGAAQGLRAVETGLDVDDVLTMEVSLPAADYARGADVTAFFERAREALAALPGVRAVGTIDLLPLNFAEGGQEYRLPSSVPEQDEAQVASLHVIGGEYVEAMDVELLSGRGFTTADDADSGRVVIVNEGLGRRLWPDASPLGRTLLLEGPEDREATIVGIVSDSVGGFVFNDLGEQIFMPHAQIPRRSGFFVIEVDGDPTALAPSARAALAGIDRDLPIDGIRAMSTVQDQAIAPLRIAASILAAFGGFALLLAALGVYGVVAYAVAQRRHEIGVRMALGARRRGIVRLVLRTGAAPVLLGALAGGVLVLGLTVVLATVAGESVEIGIAVLVPATLTAVALIASWLPARRASRIDPVIALRAD